MVKQANIANKYNKNSYLNKSFTNTMEGLYLNDKDITNIINYYNISSNTIKKDINKLLSKPKHTTKDIQRLKKYAFRYKMHIQHISDNTDSRLSKPIRKSLTTPNKDIS